VITPAMRDFLKRRGYELHTVPGGLFSAKRGPLLGRGRVEILICGDLICLFGRNLWTPIAVVWPS